MDRKIVKDNKGLTLLEVMIASFILAIVALPLLSLFANSARLVQASYQRTDGTYKAKTLMESLYGLTYSQLFQKGVSTKTSANTIFPGTATGKYYTLNLSPAGPADVVTGTTCYFHLFIDSAGAGKFVGPGDTGSLRTLTSSNIMDLRLKATTAGTTYTLHQGANTAALLSGNKPASTVPILLIITKSDSAAIKVTIDGNGSTIVYARPTLPTEQITGTPAPLVYNNDVPPTTVLVSAVMKVYKSADDTQPENIYQNTLSVGTLP